MAEARGRTLDNTGTTSRSNGSQKFVSTSPCKALRFDGRAGFRGPAAQNLIERLCKYGTRTSYARGHVLFAQGQRASGIRLLLEGSVKLSVGSASGKSIILELCQPRAILGLAATVLGRAHEVSAETVSPSTTIFVPRDSFLLLLHEQTRLALDAVRLVSQERFSLLNQMCVINLSESALQRLAEFLLRLRTDGGQRACVLPLGVSQETVAQMVGISRETLSRFLGALKRKHVLEWNRSTLSIYDWKTLQRLATPSTYAADGYGRQRQPLHLRTEDRRFLKK